MDYIFKRLDAGQIPLIAELTKQVWGQASLVDAAILTAKFLTKPFGGTEHLGFVAYPENAKPEINGHPLPVAYYGVFPILAKFGNNEVLCAQSGDTMTHPEHRGKGLFIDLAKKTYATARSEGIQFVFGFPNENSYPGFSRKLDWRFPYNMVRFIRIIPTLPIGLIFRRMGKPYRQFGRWGHFIVKQFFDEIEPYGTLWTHNSEIHSGIIRDSRLWDYKSAYTLYVQSGKIGLVLKFDGDLSIGEIMGDPSPKEMSRIMHRLDILAMMTGAIRIKSYFSPQSRLRHHLAPFGKCTPSLPYGFVNFTCKNDPSTLEYTYLDYDTF